MSVGKNLRRKARYKRAKAAVVEQKHIEELKTREAKQITKSASGAGTVSAETQATRHRGKAARIVQGGIPGQGKG